MKYKMTNEQKLENYFKAVRMRLEGSTKEEIILNTDFPSWRVLEFFMKRNNLTLPLDKAAFNKQVDVNFFKSINTPEKAYILGFTYADGCIYDVGRFGYCISENDIEVLQFIKEQMKSTSNIPIIHNTKDSRNRQPQAILRISSVKLVEDLRNYYGVNRNKTFREGLIFPNISEDLLVHFLRGLSDGDGNIYLRIKNSNATSNSSFRRTICMTDFPFLMKVKEYFHQKGVDLSIYEKQGKTCKYYIMSTGSRNHTKKLCDLLYSAEGFCLERKKAKYLQYLELMDNTVLNTETNRSVSV